MAEITSTRPEGNVIRTADLLGAFSLASDLAIGDSAREAARYDLGKRIREVEQGPDGAVWILEDRDGGRLLKLTPRSTAESE